MLKMLICLHIRKKSCTFALLKIKDMTDFKQRQAELRTELINAYIEMVNKFGIPGNYKDIKELPTFDYCSEYGCMLNGSTIDKIEYDGSRLLFYYNQNTNDYDISTEFTTSDLIDFYCDLRDSIEDEMKEQYNNI